MTEERREPAWHEGWRLAPVLFGSESAWWRPIGSLAVLLLILGMLFGSVFATERVTTDKIFSAACAYLLLGLCWSQAYQLARPLADLEALGGQLYVAVVLARLVSLQITHAGAGESRGAG